MNDLPYMDPMGKDGSYQPGGQFYNTLRKKDLRIEQRPCRSAVHKPGPWTPLLRDDDPNLSCPVRPCLF